MMYPALVNSRTTMMYWRFQPSRFFLPAAIILTLNPVASAFVCSNSRLCRYHHLSAQLNFAPHRSYSRTLLSLALSTADSSSPTNGSSAVRSKKPLPYPTDDYKLRLLSFYHFVPIQQPDQIRDILFEHLVTIEGLRGTVYVSKEGINAQFAVPIGNPLDNLIEVFGARGCLPFDTFETNPPNMGDIVDRCTPTFDKLIVRTRDYILRDGLNLEESAMDWSDNGIELDPSDWDEQLRQPNIQLLDCRNDYESDLGSFVSAKPLNTKTFSDTWSVLDSQVESQSINPDEPVYIFCTGGIRCVKVGAYLRQRLGITDVRSLRHGIIGYERWKKYADDEKKEKESLWTGQNFLFDKRRFAKDGDGTETQ